MNWFFLGNQMKKFTMFLCLSSMIFLFACGEEKKVEKKPDQKISIALIRQELDKNVILKDLVEIKEIKLTNEVVENDHYSIVAEYNFSFKKSLSDIKPIQEFVMLKSAFGDFKVGDIAKTSDPYSFIKKDGVWMIEADKTSQSQDASPQQNPAGTVPEGGKP